MNERRRAAPTVELSIITYRLSLLDGKASTAQGAVEVWLTNIYCHIYFNHDRASKDFSEWRQSSRASAEVMSVRWSG